MQSLATVQPHRFTIRDYLKMGEVGILTREDRVELIDGQVVKMTPLGNRHRASVLRLAELLHRIVPEDITVMIQNGLDIGDHHQVEPDAALVRVPDDLWDRPVTPSDCLLVVEVADSSLEVDRQAKLSLYAAAGVPEYWIIDLEGRQVEVHRDPNKDTYDSRTVHGPGEQVTALLVPQVRIPVAHVTPPKD